MKVNIDEKDFMQMVADLARLRCWLVYHTHDSRRSVAGFPDLILLRGRTQLAVELKVGRNRPTDAQVVWLDAFRTAGVQVYEWYPKDWPEIERVLEDA